MPTPAEIENALARATPDRLLVAARGAARRASPSSGSTRSPGSTRGSWSGWRRSSRPRSRCAPRAFRRTPTGLRRLKAMGFSDARLAQLALRSAGVERESVGSAADGSGIVHDALRAMTGGVTEAEVRRARHKLGVRPVFKRIDSCAAEFDAATPYLYSTYEAPLFGEPEDEAEVSRPAQDRSSWAAGRTGSGRGSSSTIAAATPPSRSKDAGFETIMVNCNPETVSTDPDTSRPALFRAADRGGRARNPPPRERRRANWSA